MEQNDEDGLRWVGVIVVVVVVVVGSVSARTSGVGAAGWRDVDNLNLAQQQTSRVV